MLIELKKPDPDMLESSNKALRISSELVINNNDDYDKASKILKRIKERVSLLNNQRLEITRPLDEAKKSIIELFKEPISVFTQAEDIVKKTILDYNKKQQAIIEEQKRKAEFEAQQERLRLEEEARKIKQQAIEEAEKIKQQESIAENFEEKMIVRSEAESIVNHAKEQVASIDQEIKNLQPAKVAIDKPNSNGVYLRETWKGRCVDIKKLINHIVLTGECLDLICVNEQLLNKIAREQKGLRQIPGVEFYSEQSVASRA